MWQLCAVMMSWVGCLLTDSEQPTQLIVELNSSLWHIIVTQTFSRKIRRTCAQCDTNVANIFFIKTCQKLANQKHWSDIFIGKFAALLHSVTQMLLIFYWKNCQYQLFDMNRNFFDGHWFAFYTQSHWVKSLQKAKLYIPSTGDHRLVRFLGPMKTALLERSH